MIVLCSCCGAEFDKKNNQIRKHNNHYCSRSCSAKVNNRNFPKRIKCMDGLTCLCGGKKTKLAKTCQKCICDKGLGRTKKDYMYFSQNKSAKWVRIREHARLVAKKNGLYDNGCSKCGYMKHVEIAHIEPISSFSDDTLVVDINDINNLIALCPNCHWELDHGQLTINK